MFRIRIQSYDPELDSGGGVRSGQKDTDPKHRIVVDASTIFVPRKVIKTAAIQQYSI